jgi:K+-sensing histidine kinase KdpD
MAAPACREERGHLMTIREAVRSFTISPLYRTADAARRAGQATQADRVRAALLAAVSHDLRSPVAAAKAAVSCLHLPDIELTAAEEIMADPADRGTGHRERDG